MADMRRLELDELVNRPGTYFNPQTEVLVTVDDSPELDAEMFDEDYDGAEWVLISDEIAVDENRRDELLESFQVAHQSGDMAALASDDHYDDEDEEELEEDELEEEPGSE